jgi:hypothetical protein
MARLPRRKVPVRIGLIVALRQLGLVKPQLDHDPALGLRDRTPDGGYIPDEHDPDYLVWREKDEHAIKTRGNGATTAGSDIGNMRHFRDVTASEQDFRDRLLRKECGKPPARNSRWPKRKLQSRNSFGRQI